MGVGIAHRRTLDNSVKVNLLPSCTVRDSGYRAFRDPYRHWLLPHRSTGGFSFLSGLSLGDDESPEMSRNTRISAVDQHHL